MTARTIPQNSALHKYLTWIASDLSAGGYDMKEVVSLPISPTMENVKECIWRKIQLAMYPDKTSTTELSTVEMQKVYEQFNSIMAEKFGVSRDWPTR